jgi:hypothetical protein
VDRALVVALILAGIAAVAVAYRARRRHARAHPSGPSRIEPGDVGLDGREGLAVVGFSSPRCLPCQAWEAALRDAGVPWEKVDVARRHDLARRYGVRQTPLVLAVELPEGRVLETYAGEPEPGEVDRLAALARAA